MNLTLGTIVRTNLTRVTSPPNSAPRRFPSYLLLYFLFIFYLPRCTLPDFPSVSSPASLPVLPCCHHYNCLAPDWISFRFFPGFLASFTLLSPQQLLSPQRDNSICLMIANGYLYLFQVDLRLMNFIFSVTVVKFNFRQM